MLKRIVSLMLSATMISALLNSCSQPQFDFEFIEEASVKEYTSTVEGAALTIYVDANANEGGDGSEKAPFKTITEAQTKIREIKTTDGLPVGGIRVLVKDGIYRIAEGFVFTEADSGTEESPIVYVAENELGTSIIGGIVLSAEDFEPINAEETSRLMDKSAAENIVKLDLTKYGLTSDDWGEYMLSGFYNTALWYDEFDEIFLSAGIDYRTPDLFTSATVYGTKAAEIPVAKEAEIFIGDTALICARWPNSGEWLKTGSDDLVFYHDTCYGNFANRNPEPPILDISGEIIERVAQWQSLEDVWTDGYMGVSWTGTRCAVDSFNFEEETMRLKYYIMYMALADGLDRNWYFFNIFDELDTAGEFYIDRNNGILYIYKTDNFYKDEIKITTIKDNLVTFENASNITFKGFNIGETRRGGFYGTAEKITIDSCKIGNLRDFAVDIVGNEIVIKNSELYNIGSYAIWLEGGDMETLTRSGNEIYNNYIHGWARVNTTPTAAVVVKGCGSLISHNELCDSPFQALWYRGPYHILEYNNIHDVLKETADCGAIYSGRNLISYGSEIRYNFIHDIGNLEYNADGVNAHGIYMDDGISGQKIYGNIIMNTAGFGLCMSSGRDMFVENNVFINTRKAPIHYSNGSRLAVIKRAPNTWNIPFMNSALEPYLNGDVWTEAFPELEGLILYTAEYDGDFDNPMLSANPANGAVRNNLLYLVNEATPTLVHAKWGYVENEYTKRIDLYSEQLTSSKRGISDIDKFNDISNNPIIFNDFSDFPNWHNDDFTMKENALGLELCSDFEPIPFDKIGRIK